MNLDEYKEGLYDNDSPINQKEVESPNEEDLTLREAFESGHERLFYKSISELILEIEAIKEGLDNNWGYSIIFKRKLNKLLEKL